MDVSGDMGWQKRGRSYSSISGHCVLIGTWSNKVIAYQNYSKHCKLCQVAESKNQPAAAHECSRNYEGSSKGMEAHGLLACVVQLWETSKLFVRRFVIDDDATTKAHAQHSYKALIDAGRMDKTAWPRTEAKHRKKDNGKLPLDHPPVIFMADRNHRVRQFAGYLYALESASKATSEMTKPDMNRLKRNFSFWLFTKVSNSEN